MSITEQSLRILVAVLAGAAIGFERQVRFKSAGLRTHILVAVGAATYLILASQVARASNQPNVQPLDPLRVLGGLIGGIGFLAAGVIIEQRGNVRGLTTAASLWLTAALGAAAGLGEYALVGLSVVVTVLVLWPIQVFERRVLDGDSQPEHGSATESKKGSTNVPNAHRD